MTIYQKAINSHSHLQAVHVEYIANKCIIQTILHKGGMLL